jgi:predicted ABC-type ATPase
VKDTNLFCAESKGIPRVKMPQMDADQTKAFIKHLKDEGYDVKKESQRANHLRATQNQLNGAKVAGIAEKMRKDPEKYKNVRLVVSKDDYILDGHHRWAGQIGLDSENNKLTAGKKMKVSRVNISITKLLEEANKFTGGKGAKGVEQAKGFEPCTACGGVDDDLDGEVDWNEELKAWDESQHPREPGGSPEGGRFTSGGGGDGGGGDDWEAHSKNPTNWTKLPGGGTAWSVPFGGQGGTIKIKNSMPEGVTPSYEWEVLDRGADKTLGEMQDRNIRDHDLPTRNHAWASAKRTYDEVKAGTYGTQPSGPHPGEKPLAPAPAYAGRRDGDTLDGKPITDVREDPAFFADKPETADVHNISSVLMRSANGYNRVWMLDKQSGDNKFELLRSDEYGNIHRDLVSYTGLMTDPHEEKTTIPHTALPPKTAPHSAPVPAEVAARADAIIDKVDKKIPGTKKYYEESAAKLADAVGPDAQVSEGGYKHGDAWTREREAYQNELMNKYLIPADKMRAAKKRLGTQPILHLLCGSGGSGKSWFTSAGGTVSEENFVHINSDDYQVNTKEFQGWNAGVLYPEATEVTRRAITAARHARVNVILDTTLNRVRSIESLMDSFRLAGYRIEMHFMDVKPEIAAERAVARSMGPQGRLFTPEWILMNKSQEAFNKMAKHADAYEVYNNDKGPGPDGKLPTPEFVARRENPAPAALTSFLE